MAPSSSSTLMTRKSSSSLSTVAPASKNYFASNLGRATTTCYWTRKPRSRKITFRARGVRGKYGITSAWHSWLSSVSISMIGWRLVTTLLVFRAAVRASRVESTRSIAAVLFHKTYFMQPSKPSWYTSRLHGPASALQEIFINHHQFIKQKDRRPLTLICMNKHFKNPHAYQIHNTYN